MTKTIKKTLIAMLIGVLFIGSFSVLTQAAAEVNIKKPVISSAKNIANGIQLKWKKIPDADGYYIYRSANNKSYSKIKTIKKVSFTDKTVKNGNTYNYKIKAYKKVKSKIYTSKYSAIKTACRLDNSLAINKSVLTSEGLYLSWEKIKNATGYSAILTTTDGNTYSTITTNPNWTIMLPDAEKISGVLKIQAYKAINNKKYYGLWSAKKSINISYSQQQQNDNEQQMNKADDSAQKCNHEYKIINSQEATCRAEGIMTYACNNCGDTYTEKMPKTEHKYRLLNEISPSCAWSGYKEYSCEYCGHSYLETLPQLKHNFVEVPGTPATCLEDGWPSVYECSLCGMPDWARYPNGISGIPATGHAYIPAITKEAACEEDGIKTFTCKNCGDAYTEIIPAIGHDYEKTVITEPTCTEKGHARFVCKNCGDIYEEDIEATGHRWAAAIMNDPIYVFYCTGYHHENNKRYLCHFWTSSERDMGEATKEFYAVHGTDNEAHRQRGLSEYGYYDVCIETKEDVPTGFVYTTSGTGADSTGYDEITNEFTCLLCGKEGTMEDARKTDYKWAYAGGQGPFFHYDGTITQDINEIKEHVYSTIAGKNLDCTTGNENCPNPHYGCVVQYSGDCPKCHSKKTYVSLKQCEGECDKKTNPELWKSVPIFMTCDDCGWCSSTEDYGSTKIQKNIKDYEVFGY